jgi:hypothetical protein
VAVGVEYKKYPIKEEFFGERFEGIKGKDAVNKLLREKRGYVPDAFYREDIGCITLVWGDVDGGLRHILKRREETGINIEDFLNDITEVVEKGNLHRNEKDPNRRNVWHNKKLVIIETLYLNEKVNWVVSAYKQRKEDKED